MGTPTDSKTTSEVEGSSDHSIDNISTDSMKRQMIHLKTKEECRLGDETIQAWAVEMPSKYAESVLRVLKERINDLDMIDLQHCRRFAKPKFLPQQVLGPRDYGKEMHSISRAWDSTPQSVMQMPHTAIWDWDKPPKTEKLLSRPQTLYLLICPTRVVARDELESVFLEIPPFSSEHDSWAYPLFVKEVTVPLLAPTSPEQADQWSEQYWPTFYRKTNPFGAHPATILKAEDDLQKPVDGQVHIERAMAMAEQISLETKNLGWGVGTGCVIVERTEDGTEIAAVAGDARLRPLPTTVTKTSTALPEPACTNADLCTPSVDENESNNTSKAKKKTKNRKKAASQCCDTGNVMGHPIMRAIGMIARKRLRCASLQITAKSAKSTATLHSAGLAWDEEARDAFFLDVPLTDLEREYFEKDNIKADGYLCLKLEIFLTHEPCVMCSMALVHSRVGRVMFKHRMPETGGLTAEMNSNHTGPIGLGYGLCWRKELNWQFMCWEYVEPAERGVKSIEEIEAEEKAKLVKANTIPGGNPFTDRTRTHGISANVYANRSGIVASGKANGILEGPRSGFGTGKGGENENNPDSSSTTKFTSKNAFDLLMDDGEDLPSDREDDPKNLPNTMHIIKSQAYINADVPSSFTSVHV